MALGSFFGRVRGALRRSGVRGVVLIAFRRTVYRRVILIERDLTEEIVLVPCDVPLRVAILRPGDAEAYARYRPDMSSEMDAAEFRRGSVCYAAWLGDRIIADAWYHPREAWIEDIQRRFELASDEAYCHDAHTSPELRGHSVTPARSTIALADLREKGYSRVVAFVLPENAAGRRSPVKSGWQPFGAAGYLKLGLARIDFIRIDGQALRWRFRRMPLRRGPRDSLPPLEPGPL